MRAQDSRLSPGRSRFRSRSPLSQPQTPRISAKGTPYDLLVSDVSFDDAISRKRPRQNIESPEETASSAWACHSMYDLVHLSGCSICQAYMSHVDEADRNPLFQKAVQSRDSKNDAYFFDGVSEGRRRQRDDDEYMFEDRERFKAERNEALEIISRFQIEAHNNQEELRSVTEQLRIARADCDRLRQRVSTANSEKQDLANELQQVLKMDVQLQQMTKMDDQMLLDHGSVTMQNSPSTDLPPNVIEPSRSESEDLSAPATTAPSTYASVASSPPPNPTSTAIAQRISHILPARPSGLVPAHTPVDLRASAARSPTSTSTSPTLRIPKTLRQLQSLMAAAHQPGNERALAKVKALCGEAHATHRDQKTDLQRYLLSNWRNPTPSPSNGTASPPAVPTAPAAMSNYSRSISNGGNPSGVAPHSQPVKNNPRLDDPIEVWYDYLCTYPSSYPRGVRRDWRNRPHLPDLRASRIVARLRPELAHGSGLHLSLRADFMTRVVAVFSMPGAYAEKIKAEGLVVSPLVMYRPFWTDANSSVSEEDVVRHFAQCGVTLEVAEKELGPWAKCYLSQAPVPSSSST